MGLPPSERSRDDHPVRFNSTQFARVKIGYDHDLAAHDFLGLVEHRDSRDNGPGFRFADIDFKMQEFVCAFDAFGREHSPMRRSTLPEVFDVDLRRRRVDRGFAHGLFVHKGFAEGVSLSTRAVSSSSSARMRSMALFASMRGKTGAIMPIFCPGINWPHASFASSRLSSRCVMPSCAQMFAVDSGRTGCSSATAIRRVSAEA